MEEAEMAEDEMGEDEMAKDEMGEDEVVRALNDERTIMARGPSGQWPKW